MKTTRKDVKVVQGEEPIATEVMAQSIRDLEATARRLLNSGLTRDALCILIHHNMPAVRRLSMRDIGAVLDAAAGLSNFLMEAKP